MKNAIVTFVIGDRYKQLHKIFRSSVEKYCKRYDIDYIVLDQPLDTDVSNHHKIGIQKLLIASQDWSSKYDKIMWLDSDIYISKNAKNVFDDIVSNKIYMVNPYFYNDKLYFDNITHERENKIYTLDEGIEIHKKMAKEFGCYNETDLNVPYYFNQGVMVFQPKHHSEYLNNLYKTEVLRNIKHGVTDINGNKNPHGEFWFQYKFQADGMLDVLDHKYNSVWTFYRSLHYTPYDSQIDLLLPLKKFIDNSYFCHFTDMEDVDMLCKIKDFYLETPPTTLLVNYKVGTDMSWMLSKYMRSKEFENIYITENARHIITSQYPRQQTGFVFPSHKYTFVHELPKPSGRCIVCDSDWLKTTNFEYILHLFNNDENSNELIKVVNF